MLAKKIIKNLETGNYRIEYREECECDFYWHTDKDGEVSCETVRAYGTCYFHNVLIMDDLVNKCDGDIIVGSDGVIACYDTYFGVSLQVLCLDKSTEKRILKYIINDAEIYCQLIATINYPDKCNELHEKRKIKSLLEHVEWKKENS